MKRIVAALAMIIAGSALAGCANRFIGDINAIDKILEGEVDAILGEIRDRVCKLPVDVLARQAAGSSDTAAGLWYMCPELRSLSQTLINAASQRALDVTVTVAPAP